MSRPRYQRGSRVWCPAAITTRRPAGGDLVGKLHAGGRGADHQHAARRQHPKAGDNRPAPAAAAWRGIAPASAGTYGRSQCPVATTTARACHLPAVVTTGRPVPQRRTARTVDAGRVPARDRRRRSAPACRHLAGGHVAVGIRAVVGEPGRRVCQFGVSRRSESHRSLRQRSPMRPRSSTTWSMPRSAQAAAHREPGLAAADHTRRRRGARHQPACDGDVDRHAVGEHVVHRRSLRAPARRARAADPSGASPSIVKLTRSCS